MEALFEAYKPDIYDRKEEFNLLEVIRYLRKVLDRKKFSGDLESARAKYADIIDQSITTVQEAEDKKAGFSIKQSRKLISANLTLTSFRKSLENRIQAH
ncbi:MAG: hypothetical protein IPL22_18980 [Bacteroidetes bacterium]|nr:hypothetical protein [Bacteroidota bacterium]